jgi:hypothetical protein
VRFLVVDEHGKPLDLAVSTTWIAAVDEQGRISVANFVRETRGVCELHPLEPGPYWVFFGLNRYERTVRTVSIGAGVPTLEERVVLTASPYRGGAIQMEGGRDHGKLTWFESSAKSRTTLAVRFTNPSGEDLASQFVICGRKSLLDGMSNEFPAGPIQFTLGGRGKGRIEIRSPGYAPTGVDVDFDQSGRIDLGETVLQPAVHVRARLLAPADANVTGVWLEYSPHVGLERAGRYWTLAGFLGENDLELGAEPFVVGALARRGSSFWRSPRIVFDPERDGRELTLSLVEVVPLILEPISFHDLLDLEVLDEAGLLVERRAAFVDVPERIELIPGTYTLRHSVKRGTDEPRVQRVVLGSELQRLRLER